MHEVKIYSQEKEDGIDGLVKSSASVAYATQLRLSDNTSEVSKAMAEKLEKAISQEKQEDLYYLDSVLVTTSWNRNDDVFAKEEVWAAKTSPENKPFNIEHDEHKIIGHITGNWTIDDNGSILKADTPKEQLPDTFHIVTSSVVYKHWTDPELILRTQQLIESIEAGEKFVSMECLFTDFDYALKSEDGRMHTLARNEESAFLTKHLRAYGGDGHYQSYKIGRLLKNINFCGHGLVSKPANPASIIFDKYKPFNAPTEGTLAYFMSSEAQDDSSKKETNMSESIYKTQIEELKASVARLEESNAELEGKLAEANVKEYEAKISEMTASAEAQLEELESAKSEVATASEELAEAKSKIEELEAELATTNEAKAELQSKIDEIEAAKVLASRMASLQEAGMTEEEATVALDKFGDIDEEQFAAIAEQLLVIKGKNDDTSVAEEISEASEEESEEESEELAEAEEDITEDEAEASADEEVLEEAEASEEVALSTSYEDEAEDTRVALSGLIANKFLNSVK